MCCVGGNSRFAQRCRPIECTVSYDFSACLPLLPTMQETSSSVRSWPNRGNAAALTFLLVDAGGMPQSTEPPEWKFEGRTNSYWDRVVVGEFELPSVISAGVLHEWPGPASDLQAPEWHRRHGPPRVPRPLAGGWRWRPLVQVFLHAPGVSFSRHPTTDNVALLSHNLLERSCCALGSANKCVCGCWQKTPHWSWQLLKLERFCIPLSRTVLIFLEDGKRFF